jgi:hypothetical protein
LILTSQFSLCEGNLIRELFIWVFSRKSFQAQNLIIRHMFNVLVVDDLKQLSSKSLFAQNIFQKLISDEFTSYDSFDEANPIDMRV